MRGLRALRAGTAETEARQVEATGQVEATASGHARHAAALHGRGERSHLLLLQVLGRPVGVTDRGEHEVGDGPVDAIYSAIQRLTGVKVTTIYALTFGIGAALFLGNLIALVRRRSGAQVTATRGRDTLPQAPITR